MAYQTFFFNLEGQVDMHRGFVFQVWQTTVCVGVQRNMQCKNLYGCLLPVLVKGARLQLSDKPKVTGS